MKFFLFTRYFLSNEIQEYYKTCWFGNLSKASPSISFNFVAEAENFFRRNSKGREVSVSDIVH